MFSLQGMKEATTGRPSWSYSTSAVVAATPRWNSTAGDGIRYSFFLNVELEFRDHYFQQYMRVRSFLGLESCAGRSIKIPAVLIIFLFVNIVRFLEDTHGVSF